MILILAEEQDISSDFVAEWLSSMQIPYHLLNDAWDAVDKVVMSNGGIEITLHSGLNFSDITAVWFRRGYFIFSRQFELEEENKTLGKAIGTHLKQEAQTLQDICYHYLKQKPSINHPSFYNISKLVVLEKAVKHGLLIPPTIVTNRKKTVQNYQKATGNLITKNIQDILSVPLNQERIGTSTKNVKQEDYQQENFFYSLFQKAIDKRYELRVFYINGKFYSAAIFSQLNEKSKEDSRMDTKDKPTRIVPFLLPTLIKKKVDALMKDLSLESGSIDFIVDHNLDFYFLEVNPVGQFDYVSKRCNYQLDHLIAQELTSLHEKESI